MSLILYEWRDHPVQNLLGPGAQYQMEPGSSRCTKESSPHPKGGLGYRGGEGAPVRGRRSGEKGGKMYQMLQPHPKNQNGRP